MACAAYAVDGGGPQRLVEAEVVLAEALRDLVGEGARVLADAVGAALRRLGVFARGIAAQREAKADQFSCGRIRCALLLEGTPGPGEQAR